MAETFNWLERSSQAHPERLAVTDGRGLRLSYRDLRDRAGSVAALLERDGLLPGDPVAIDLPAGVPHVVALHGAILAGAVVQPLPPSGREGVEVALGTRYLDTATLASGEDDPAEWKAIKRDQDSALTRVLTSGTSGEPKAVLLTAANHAWSARASAWNLSVVPDDRWLCCLPLNHIGGLSILIRSVIYGTGVVIHDGFDVARVAAAMTSGDATVVSLVPTQLVRLLDADAAIGVPRLLLVGGGPVSADVLGEALGRGATVVQTYGLTEACSQVCTLAPDEARARVGSAGKPLAGVEVRIDDGEILVAGPTVAPASVAADGWLHTGDLGRLDDDGYLWVEGRRDDLIVTGGENVRPERVEDVLRSHPDVADAGVAGVDDREWGQIVVAWVVSEGERDLDPAGLIDHARARLQRHEVPKRIEITNRLPRTSSGKLLRRELSKNVQSTL